MFELLGPGCLFSSEAFRRVAQSRDYFDKIIPTPETITRKTLISLQASFDKGTISNMTASKNKITDVSICKFNF